MKELRMFVLNKLRPEEIKAVKQEQQLDLRKKSSWEVLYSLALFC